MEQPVPTPSVPLAFSELREVLSALQSQTKRTTRLINQLHNRLSRTFPELAVVCPDLSAGYVLSLLIKYPTAQKVAAARLSSLSEISYLRLEKASEIQAEDRAMLGSNTSAALDQSPKPGWGDELHPDFLLSDFHLCGFQFH